MARRAASAAAGGSCSSRSRLRRTWGAKRWAWRAVWPWPRSRDATGRSAVRESRGTRAWKASARAGPWLTAAVPEVDTAAAGRRVASAMPSAMCAAERSSMATVRRIRGSWYSAMTSGALRDPGETTASLRPLSASTFTSSAATRCAVVFTAQRYQRPTAPPASAWIWAPQVCP